MTNIELSIKQEEPFIIKSLNLASYLIYQGIEPIGTEIIDGSVHFIYPNDRDTHTAVRLYQNDRKIKEYVLCFKRVKDMLNESKMQFKAK